MPRGSFDNGIEHTHIGIGAGSTVGVPLAIQWSRADTVSNHQSTASCRESVLRWAIPSKHLRLPPPPWCGARVMGRLHLECDYTRSGRQISAASVACGHARRRLGTRSIRAPDALSAGRGRRARRGAPGDGARYPVGRSPWPGEAARLLQDHHRTRTLCCGRQRHCCIESVRS